MELQIQYARTSDNVSIAYVALGEGPAVIAFGMPGTHLQAEWEVPEIRQTYENAARLSTFIRFDPRGFGLSDRDVENFSPSNMARDLEAVVERTGADRFSLIGLSWGGMVAIEYAARHPDRVSRIVLEQASARGSDYMNEQLRALAALAQHDWKLASESIYHFFAGWANHEQATNGARVLRAAITPQKLAQFVDQMGRCDVSDRLSLVVAPVLLIPGARVCGVDVQRRMASVLPDARVTNVSASEEPDLGRNAAAMVEFFIEGLASDRPPLPPRSANASFVVPENGAPASPLPPSGTAVILFADIVDSTALTERMGDAAFRERARALDLSMREIIKAAGGTTIDAKTLRDGVLATFSSAAQAIDAALRCSTAGDAQSLRLHVGLHAGDVIREDDNVFGGTVNIAARISALSAPGEVLVSDTVRSLARTSASVVFEDRGEHSLKGVADAVRAYAVRRLG